VNKSNIENLERLNKRPQENSYRVSLSKQFDKASGTKQSQETEVDETVLQHTTTTSEVMTPSVTTRMSPLQIYDDPNIFIIIYSFNDF